MELQKNGETIILENPGHVAAYLDAGWDEVKEPKRNRLSKGRVSNGEAEQCSNKS